MAIDGKRLFALLDAVGNDNAKGEYYLTDIVAIARKRGWGATVVETDDADEVMGVNSRADLARAEAAMQRRLRAAAMANGATLVDPDTVWLSWDTALGRDVTVGPNVWFGPGVTIGDNVEVRAFCHIEGATVASGALVGPFARLRPGADLGRDVHVGNFVEVKEATLEEGAKANHLSYIGDSRVGAGANIGAGTITCNYDGFFKSRTDIGAGAFIGSNTALVAPVTVGDGAIVGAGSVIAKDVAPDALAVTRAPQEQRAGWAIKYRTRKKAEKDAAQSWKKGGRAKKAV
jgi:bifunctional UDP-N-acetylglucosamine pyrophosphorylase/glucosamine-1-phosphate N-acetyltransferase